MADTTAPLEIPNRALFKATEVCDLVQVQPYVLRTWEAEFPNLGVAKAAGAPRVYRREDVEQVVRIKHLLLVEGLTLAGARRKIEQDAEPSAADVADTEMLLSATTRQKLSTVKQGLRSILELLTATAPVNEFALTPQAAMPAGRVAAGFSRTSETGRASESRVAAAAQVRAAKPGPSPRPKRST